LGDERVSNIIKGITTKYKRNKMKFGPFLDDQPNDFTTHWSPPGPLMILPFIWARANSNDRHHFGDVMRTNSILAHALGFENSIEYVKTRGWTCKYNAKDGKFDLQYRRVFDTLECTSSRQTLHTENLNAMLLNLYKYLKLEETKNPIGGTQPLQYMKFESFLARLNSHAQDLQIAAVTVLKYFLPFAPHHPGDVEYWLKRVFDQCRTSTVFRTFCNDIFPLLPPGAPDSDGSFQIDLMTNHLASMRDRVSFLAKDRQAKARYDADVHRRLAASVGTYKKTVPADKHSDRLDDIIRTRTSNRVIAIMERRNPGLIIESPTYNRKRKKVGEF